MLDEKASARRTQNFKQRDNVTVAMEGDGFIGWPARHRHFLQLVAGPSDSLGEPNYAIGWVTMRRVKGQGCARPRRIVATSTSEKIRKPARIDSGGSTAKW